MIRDRRFLSPRLERDELGTVLRYLEIRGIHAWRMNSGSIKSGGHWIRLAPRGTPDVVGFLPDGRFLGIELKKPGDRRSNDGPARRKTREAQLKFLAELNLAGGLGISGDCADKVIDELEERLTERRRKGP